MKYLITVLVVVLSWLAGLGCWHLFYNGIHIQTSQGTQTGTISAVEKNGWLFPMYEAYVKTNPQSSQEDRYCVIDPTVYTELQTLSSEQKISTISYIDYLVQGAKSCGVQESIEGIITGVK